MAKTKAAPIHHQTCPLRGGHEIGSESIREVRIITSMANKVGLSKCFRMLRPNQFYKASIVWLPALFHGAGAIRREAPLLLQVTLAWILASGCIYILNDFLDLKEDRSNPLRADRPLASGSISPTLALGVGLLSLLLLGLLAYRLPLSLAWLLGGYFALNLAYSLGLKQSFGLRQMIVAVGFWLRLKAGAEPVTSVPLTPWAAMFTLGLAYFLTSMKGFGTIPSGQATKRWAMGLGAGLAGALALTALASLTLKRAAEGRMNFPEMPPILCLLGMHRFAYHSSLPESQREQATAIFKDPVILGAIAAFALLLL